MRNIVLEIHLKNKMSEVRWSGEYWPILVGLLTSGIVWFLGDFSSTSEAVVVVLAVFAGVRFGLPFVNFFDNERKLRYLREFTRMNVAEIQKVVDEDAKIGRFLKAHDALPESIRFEPKSRWRWHIRRK